VTSPSKGLPFIRVVLDPEARAAWAKRHGCEPFDGACPSCATIVRVDVPMHYHGAVGLTADPCPNCGEGRMPFSFHWNELAAMGERRKVAKGKRRAKAKVIQLRRPT
jgi:hypothetical protein